MSRTGWSLRNALWHSYMWSDFWQKPIVVLYYTDHGFYDAMPKIMVDEGTHELASEDYEIVAELTATDFETDPANEPYEDADDFVDVWYDMVRREGWR